MARPVAINSPTTYCVVDSLARVTQGDIMQTFPRSIRPEKYTISISYLQMFLKSYGENL